MGKNVRLGFILFFALGLRLISLNQSLWLDEAIQVTAVSGHSLKNLLFQYFQNEFHPPLSYLISWIWMRILGDSEVISRLPSVILGVANVWLVYLLADKVLPKVKIGLVKIKLSLAEIAALLLAAAPLHIYYSQEARSYVLACFLGTWSIYQFLKIINGERTNWRYLIATSLLLYSHYLVWFLLPVQAIFLYIWKKKLIWPRFIKTWGLSLLLFAPWLPILVHQLEIGRGVAQTLPVWAQLGALSFKNTALIPIKFMIGRISVENNFVYISIIALLILFNAWIISKARAGFCWLWLILPIGLGMVISLQIPVLQYFRFLFVLPAFYLLLTTGLSRINRRWQTKALLVLLVINLTSSGIYLFNQNFHREDWRSAVKFVQVRDANPAVVMIKAVQAPYNYYDQGQSRMVGYREIEKIRFEKRIWLVKYAQPIFEPDNQTEEKLKGYGFIEANENHFRGVTIKYLVNPSGLTAEKLE